VSSPKRHTPDLGFSLIELLCVIAIIVVLASLLLGPAARVLQRVLADKWAEDAQTRLSETIHQLNQHFQGAETFPLVTLDWIESQGLLKSAELQFLKDPRVTFVPFAGSDPSEKIVIAVQLKRGFWNDSTVLTERKEAVTHMPN
jgi:prepilin-type N-terminal cleavage/methylation domain-containing protein